jgi:adenylate cyclase
LAEAYRIARRFDEGLAAIADALAIIDKTDERHCAANLHRTKGDLILRRSDGEPESGAEPEAEECFRKSIEIARQQEARALELKAAMSLSRLWQQQGRRDEARAMLAEIYNWFTEGFDTADLKDSKALLDELSA